MTEFDHGGAWGEDVMADQVGSPERLMEVTSQPRPTATLHIRDPGHSFSMTEGGKCDVVWIRKSFVPRNPLPPQTTIFFAINASADLVGGEKMGAAEGRTQ